MVWIKDLQIIKESSDDAQGTITDIVVFVNLT